MTRSRRLAAFLALYAGYVAFLHLVPGPWQVRKPRGALDGWTVTHVAWGGLARRFGLSFGELLALGALNEVGEAALRKLRPDLLWGEPEPPSNVAFDLLGNSVGFLLAE